MKEPKNLNDEMDDEDIEGFIENDSEPCPTCGHVDGTTNPCCPGYDPLSYANCGYG